MRWNNGVIHQKEHGRWHRWTIQIHSGSLGFGSSFIHENSHLSEFTPKLHTDPLCMPPCRSIILCCSFLSTLSNSSDAVIVLPHFAAPSTSSECMPNSPQQHGLAQDGWVQLVHNEPSKLSTCFLMAWHSLFQPASEATKSYQVSGTLVDPILEQWQLRWEKQCDCLVLMGLTTYLCIYEVDVHSHTHIYILCVCVMCKYRHTCRYDNV